MSRVPYQGLGARNSVGPQVSPRARILADAAHLELIREFCLVFGKQTRIFRPHPHPTPGYKCHRWVLGYSFKDVSHPAPIPPTAVLSGWSPSSVVGLLGGAVHTCKIWLLGPPAHTLP